MCVCVCVTCVRTYWYRNGCVMAIDCTRRAVHGARCAITANDGREGKRIEAEAEWETDNEKRKRREGKGR